MAPAMTADRVSEIKLSWAHVVGDGAVARMRRNPQHQQYPDFETLRQNVTDAPADMNDVLIRTPDDETVLEMRQWLDENAKRKYKMFGRFGWSDHGFSVERSFLGVLFKFTDENAAFFFKMRFYQGF